jgi:hypothetical protein
MVRELFDHFFERAARTRPQAFYQGRENDIFKTVPYDEPPELLVMINIAPMIKSIVTFRLGSGKQ